MTHQEMCISLIQLEERPLMFKQILRGIQIRFNENVKVEVLRQMLYLACKEKKIKRYKKKGCPSFYCHPDWVVKGRLIKELRFNLLWHEDKQVQVQ